MEGKLKQEAKTSIQLAQTEYTDIERYPVALIIQPESTTQYRASTPTDRQQVVNPNSRLLNEVVATLACSFLVVGGCVVAGVAAAGVFDSGASAVTRSRGPKSSPTFSPVVSPSLLPTQQPTSVPTGK